MSMLRMVTKKVICMNQSMTSRKMAKMQNSRTAITGVKLAMMPMSSMSDTTVRVTGTPADASPCAIRTDTGSDTGVDTSASVRTNMFSEPTTRMTNGMISLICILRQHGSTVLKCERMAHHGTAASLMPSSEQMLMLMIIEIASSTAAVKASPKRE